MNGSFAVEQAREFAAGPTWPAWRATSNTSSGDAWLPGRPAEADGVALGLRFRKEAAGPAKSASRLSPWEQYAQVLLEANEFAFVD